MPDRIDPADAPDSGSAGPTGRQALPSRRAVLRAGVGAAVLAAAPLTARATPAEAFSDERTFSSARAGSALRSRRGVVTIRDRVVVTGDVTVGGIVVERAGSLVFAPGRSVTLRSRGNVVVRGTLEMAPRDRSIRHRLVFDGIDESAMVGGTPIRPSDVGLWVRGSGRLLLDGAAKTAWVRAAGDLNRGSTRLVLRAAPVGWARGDELVVTPTAATTAGDAHERHETVRVVSVSGRTVTVTPALAVDHPAQVVGRGTVVTAEVLNLTRNVRIEGRPGRRAHVHIMGDRPQDMRHFALRYLGPRQRNDEGFTETILGRYALHFHMMGAASRGTLVAGAVVRDAGSHAFVPHGSHGITFRSCISHDTMDEAFWWDGAPTTRIGQMRTSALTYDSCVASRVRSDPPARGYRLAGFSLGAGAGNRAVDCVAVGVQGSRNAAGFLWPEGGEGVWGFRGCVAHNNRVNGIFTWQNTDRSHLIQHFVGYHNGQAGIEHGAYLNAYRYEDSVLYGNGDASVLMHALSAEERSLTLDNLWCDGAGVAAFGIQLVRHTLDSSRPMIVSRCLIRNHRVAALGLDATDGSPDRVDVVDCDVSGNEVRAADGWVGGVVRWSDAGRGAFRVEPTSSGAAVVPGWNASKRPIADFATHRAAPERTPLPARPAAAVTLASGRRARR